MTQPDHPTTAGHSPPPLAGESVAFTGTLASMTHQQAGELAVEHGGTVSAFPSRSTTMIVIGEEGWPLEPDGRRSAKLTRADELRQTGHAIRIYTESEWLKLLGLTPPTAEEQAQYTPAMLSQALGVGVSLIRRWERIGLIKPVRRVFRLPYFDLKEAENARRLSELLDAGAAEQELEQSLTQLLGNADRAIAQLGILVRDRHLVLRDERGIRLPQSGQRLFDFDPDDSNPPPADATEQDTLPFENFTADDWFARAEHQLDQGERDSAIESLRLALMERPRDAEGHFQLAEALYLTGKREAAIERYHIAVEIDGDYIEAWTQLGCLYAEEGDSEAAISAFRIALRIHPDYPDALFHLGHQLANLKRFPEAVTALEDYLRFDRQGPWAEMARQQLALVRQSASTSNDE